MATTVHSQRLFQSAVLNRAGIRRLKLVDARSCEIVPGGLPGSALYDAPGTPAGLVALQTALVWYEFVFPTDQPCGMQIQMQTTASGAAYYTQTVSFELPQLSPMVSRWAHHTRHLRWIALAEDWNGAAYLLGHPERGLVRSFAASTGASTRDRNQQGFTLTAEQLVPYYTADSYEDDVLFPQALLTTDEPADYPPVLIYQPYLIAEMAKYQYQTIHITQVRRGDTFSVALLASEDIDLAGASLRAQVRRYPSDPTVLLELDCEIDGQYILLSKPAAEMGLIPGKHCYDVELTDSEADVSTLFGGRFEVTDDVTRL